MILVKTPCPRSWCHMECEIKALVILSIYDDVLCVGIKDPYDHFSLPQGHLKKAKVKVKNT